MQLFIGRIVASKVAHDQLLVAVHYRVIVGVVFPWMKLYEHLLGGFKDGPYSGALLISPSFERIGHALAGVLGRYVAAQHPLVGELLSAELACDADRAFKNGF